MQNYPGESNTTEGSYNLENMLFAPPPRPASDMMIDRKRRQGPLNLPKPSDCTLKMATVSETPEPVLAVRYEPDCGIKHSICGK